MADTLLDLKEDGKLRARINKEEVFAYILIKDLHSNVFKQLKATTVVLRTRWMMESAILAILDVFS